MLIINEKIPGWMTTQDLKILALIAGTIKPNSTLVEIGSFVGRSTWTLSKNLPNTCRLHTIDTFEISKIYNPNSLNYIHNELNEILCPIEELNFTRNTIQQDNNWKSAFLHYTKDCNNIDVFEMHSDYYIPLPDTSAAFIDGDHSPTQLKKDLSKFDYNKEILLFGDDFYSNSLDVISTITTQQELEHDRILIRLFGKTKLWFLWPTTGYYTHMLEPFLHNCYTYLKTPL